MRLDAGPYEPPYDTDNPHCDIPWMWWDFLRAHKSGYLWVFEGDDDVSYLAVTTRYGKSLDGVVVEAFR